MSVYVSPYMPNQPADLLFSYFMPLSTRLLLLYMHSFINFKPLSRCSEPKEVRAVKGPTLLILYESCHFV